MAVGRDDSFEEVERAAERLASRFKAVDQVLADTEEAVKSGKVTAEEIDRKLKRAVARGAVLGGPTPTGARPPAPAPAPAVDQLREQERALYNQRQLADQAAQVARQAETDAAKQERQAAGRYRAAQTRLRNLQEKPAFMVGAGPEAQAAHQVAIGRAGESVERARGVAEAASAETAARRQVAQAAADEAREIRQRLSAVRTAYTDARNAVEQEAAAARGAAQATERRALAERLRVQLEGRLRTQLEREANASQQAAQATTRRAIAEQEAAASIGRSVTLHERLAGRGRQVVDETGFRRISQTQGPFNMPPGAQPPPPYDPRALAPYYPTRLPPGYVPPNIVGEQPPPRGPFNMPPVAITDPRRMLPRGTPDFPGAGSARDVPGDMGRASQATKQWTNAQHEAAIAQREIRLRMDGTRSAIRDSTVAFADNANTIRRHGALTAEWVEQARRGETTMRELGYQVGTTIGKFGGWLLAGSAVFAVVDAFRALREGALAANNGVNQLHRVVTTGFDPGQVQAQFSGLAGHFNVPIDQATQSVYGMAKAFRGDLPQALEGSRAVLYAVKVGEMDVADATKYLTSISQGFGFTARQQVDLFDQINQAQNRYGVSIDSTLAGVAKSAGIFKTFGGNARESATQLIALITTISRASGQTGDVAGTALQRAPNFFRRPDNQAALHQYGIDASKTINEVFAQAMRIAPTLSGPERGDVAKLLFGPQYGARVGTALLNQTQLYNRVLQDVSPVNARGSAERELQRTLRSVSEQITKVRIEFQQMGVELARSGAGVPAYGMLKGFQQLLGTVNNLLRLFNELPRPLRTVVSTLAEVVAVMTLLRRLRFGDILEERVGPRTAALFNPNPQRYQERLERRGTRLYRESLQEAVAGSATAEQRAQIRSIQAQRTAISELAVLRRQTIVGEAEYAALTAEQKVGVTTQERLLADINTVKARVDAAELRAVEAAIARKEITEEYAAVASGNLRSEEALAEIKQREFLAYQAGADATAAMAVPGARRPTTPDIALGETAEFEALTAQRAAEMDIASAGRARRIFLLAKGRIGGVVATMREIGAGIADAIFNPLGLALIALMAIPDAVEHYKQREREVGDQLQRYATVTGSPTQVERQLHRQQAPTATPLAATLDRLKHFDINPFDWAVELTGRQKLQAQRRVAQRMDQSRIEIQRNAAAQDKPVPFLSVNEIVQQYRSQAQAFRQGRINSNELREAYNKARVEIHASAESINGSKNSGVAVANAYRDLNSVSLEAARSAGDIQRAAAQASLVQLGTSLQNEAAQVSLFGVTRQRLRSINIQYAEAVRRISADPSRTADFQKAQAAQQQLIGSLQQQLQQTLTLARTPAERSAAYNQFFSGLGRVETGQTALTTARAEQSRRKGDLERAKQRQRNLQRQYDQQAAEARRDDEAFRNRGNLMGPPAPGGTPEEQFQRQLGVDPDFGRGRTQALRQQQNRRRAELGRLRRRLGEQNEKVKNAADLVKQNDLAIRALEQQTRDQRFDERAAQTAATVQIRAAMLPAGMARLRYLLQQAGLAVQRAIEHYKAGSIQALTAIQQQQQAADNVAQEGLAEIQARGQLREAGLGPDATQQQHLGTLQQILKYQLAHPRTYGGPRGSAVLNTLAEIKQTRYDIGKQAEQDAQDTINALYDYRESKTDDPVRRAKLEADRARAILRSVLGGPHTGAEALRARAEVNNQVRNQRDAVVQAALDDIHHREAVGKLTNEGEIAALQHLLHTYKMSKQARNQITEEIYRLSHEGQQDLELNVGNIRLPTLYDIRRLAAGGTAAGRQTQVTQVNHVNVNASGANVNDAAKAFYNDAATHLKANLRSS